MASVGAHIELFNEQEDQNWETYLERLEIQFVVKKVKDDEKVAVLLSCLGPKAYERLRNLMAPDKPITKAYDAVTKVLTDHYSPKPLVSTERVKFYNRYQAPDESMSQYLAELRKIAANCDFTDLDQQLTTKFMAGMCNGSVQQQLMCIDRAELTLDKALKVALANEVAQRDSKKLQQQAASSASSSGSSSVDKVNAKGRKNTNNTRSQNFKCFCCGKPGHTKTVCRFKDSSCHLCGRQGHLKAVCKSKGRPKGNQGNPSKDKQSGSSRSNQGNTSRKQRSVRAMEEEDDDDLFLNVVGLVEETVHAASADVIWVTPTIAGKPIQMELDTGAAVSLLPHNLYVENFSHMPLEDTPVVLKTYGGERLMPEGKLNVNVDYLGQVVHTSLYVVKVDGPALFGRDWLRLIKLNWHEIKAVCSAHPRPPAKLNSLLAEFKEVHSGDMGKLNGVKAKFHVKEGTTPKYRPARQVPYAIRPNVERELQRLQDLNIITPVESSEWATPVVPVMKGNGEVRLCGDFKTTLNPHLIVDQYPLPKVEDVFATLGPGETFTKLDLKQAYLQMEVDDESKQYLTITTSKGLFQYNRLIYGVASAPAIFQRTIEQVLSGCNGVKVMLDDIIITGKTEEEHIENLRCVLTKLKERGLKLNPAKCEYMQKEVAFLGHIIDATGIHMIEDKVQAVNDAPAPTDINELRAFLGLINYYHRFIPNLAAILRPLYGLLQKTQKWYWSEAHERAFCRAKEEIVSMRVLTHYDPDLPITLATDASPYGLGAVLSHVMRDGEERPIAYASKSLTPAEKNYAQIDKEALAIVWAVKKFYMYIFGREFTLITDHKPLTSIFHPAKNIPAIAAARLTRYAMFLAGLQYKIQYRNTKEHCNADGLSRLPQKLTEGSRVGPDGANIMNVSQFQQLPVTATQVQRETERDKIMSQAYNFTVNGWSDKPEEEDLIPFYNRRYELSTYGGCLMWGLRVIIPPKLQKQVLEELHEGHLGVVKMKNLARSYIWWPGFNKDIEQLAKSCPGCQSTQHLPKKAPLHPWEWPSKPWERIHIDYAGPVDGMMFLVVVDAHSKWPEVILTKTSTSAKTIMILRNIFARFGLPSQLVSDNATTFTSEEFQNFLKINGVKHITSAPYHPSTNGLAERFVQSFKAALKSAKRDAGTVQHKLASFLMAYRNTAHSTTGVSPAEIFLGRPLRTRLDILKPDIARKVADKQAEQVKTRGATKMREFTVGQKVAVRDYRAKPHKWVTGTINAKTGPLSYKVNVGGQIWRRHVDQLKDTAAPETEAREIPETNQANYPAPALQQRENNRPAQPENNRPAQPENNRPVQQQNRPDKPGNQPQRHTRIGRLVKPNPKYSSDIYQRT